MITTYNAVLELDDLYYKRYEEGATLQELKRIRMLQEEQLNALPVQVRKRVTQQINERYYATLATSSAQKVIQTGQTD
jgi:hypothetical protein